MRFENTAFAKPHAHDCHGMNAASSAWLKEHSLPSPASALRPLPPPVCMAAKSLKMERRLPSPPPSPLPFQLHASRSIPRTLSCMHRDRDQYGNPYERHGERLSLVAAASGHAPPSPPNDVPCRASQYASKVAPCRASQYASRVAPCRASQYASRGSTSDGFITRIRRVASSEKASISTRSPASSAPAASPMYTRTSSSVHPTPA